MSARVQAVGEVVSAHHIAYVTGLDGWGECGEPSQEDRETFCALVEARLQTMFPEHTVEAYVDDRALESTIMTDDPNIDAAELCATIGTDVWDAWCSGERVQS